MASFNDLWDRLQGAERTIYQELEERYQNYAGNASVAVCADTAIGSIRSLAVDETDVRSLWEQDYTYAYRYPSASEYTVSCSVNDARYVRAGYINSIDHDGRIIYHSTAGWDANWIGHKEDEIGDVSEEELMSVIGLEDSNV